MNTVTLSNGSPREPQHSVSLIVIGIIVFLLFMGCKGTQQLAVTEHVTHDTCYLSNVKYDSIYINNYHYIDRGKDTIVICDKSVEFRYKLLRDTVKVIRQDSIPYQVKVVETKTERYTPWYARILAFVGFLVLVWYLLKLVVYIYKKTH